jgi:hypothetical protein
MASAFEQLLDAFRAKELNETLGTLLSTYGSTTVSETLPARAGICVEKEYEKAQLAWPVHRKWMQEFYQLRNSYVHGNDVDARNWGWTPAEHAVMAAFAFPLAVKLLLSQEGHYTPTDDDVGSFRAVDQILSKVEWGKVIGNWGNQTVWNETLRECRRDIAATKAVEKAVEAYEQMKGKEAQEEGT